MHAAALAGALQGFAAHGDDVSDRECRDVGAAHLSLAADHGHFTKTVAFTQHAQGFFAFANFQLASGQEAEKIAGFAFAISERAHLDLTYRYLMSNMEFDSFTSTAAANPGPFVGRYDDSHTLTLGLRYAFGADEPAYIAPPPPPPPEAARGQR